MTQTVTKREPLTKIESHTLPRMNAFGHKIIRVMAINNELSADYNTFIHWQTPIVTENMTAKKGGCAHTYVPDGFNKNMRRCTKCDRVEVG